jgi:uncharacterized protein (TIGR04255 family)
VIDKTNLPLFGNAPKSVPLRFAPLVSVLVQARFAEVFSISKKEFVAAFQERIRQRYPASAQETGNHVNLVGGKPQIRQVNSWKFLDETGNWSVVLTTTFVTLQTQLYTSRTDFIARFDELIAALADTIKPSLLQRVGVRYIDQIKGPEFAQLDSLINPAIKGMEDPELRMHIVQSMHDTICKIEEGMLRARWGIVPSQGSHDQSILPALNEMSWVLDLDTYKELPEGEQNFDRQAIVNIASKLATRSYAVFRWAVTNKFIEAYGGK